ncbi:MAG: hypothetical protein ABIM40_02555, partial [Pseudomonadota bacterium]
MKTGAWRWIFGLALVALSGLVYAIHYAIFHDAHHIFIYMVGDIAFVPVEVLLVTLILHELLKRREKKEMMEKVNMVIGVFFHEMGTELLNLMTEFLADRRALEERLEGMRDWTEADFARAAAEASAFTPAFWCAGENLVELREFLVRKRGFIVRLLVNPNLMEHEQFPRLLWSVTHIIDELHMRPSVDKLCTLDGEHVAGDLRRAFHLLLSLWLSHMAHLKSAYPYMYPIALAQTSFGR